MKTSIIQIGNSLGVRLPADDLRKAGLQKGDEIEVKIKKLEPDYRERNRKAVAALRAIAESGSPLTELDVEAWEAERRAAYADRERRLRDILGR